MLFVRRILDSFSTIGLLLGVLCFCISLTPSLLPRDPVVQGVLSGIVFATGYGLGWTILWIWRFMELKDLNSRSSRIILFTLLPLLSVICIITLSRLNVWQNSIRIRMEMPPLETTYLVYLCGIALATALLIIFLMWLFLFIVSKIVDAINRYLPRRIAIVLGYSFCLLLLVSFVNGVIVKNALHVMDESFALMNKLLDDEYDKPLNSKASGSSQSHILWGDIGRNGKRFIADGPQKDDIADVLGREAMQPIRVYAGFDTGETLEERAQIALAEMKRVGGFNRSILIIATTTGTGWLDPSATDTVEFIHAGDIATVTLQYSYLPSWLTLMVEPSLAREAAGALFRAIYDYWATLPRDNRPELYLHGLSLGALGSADSFDLITTITHPIKGALWSGPPFLSRMWSSVTRNRNPGSPQWRPVYKDSSAIRFMTQDGFPTIDSAEWGLLRIVYLQHASDPMSFFSTSLAYSSPDWLSSDRGRDISPYLKWFPIISFFQIAFDIPMATSVPLGYGHNFAPADYIDAWLEVTQPRNWSEEDTNTIKEHFIDFNPRPL